MPDEPNAGGLREGGYDVFYNPEFKTVVEVYDVDGEIVADVPGDGLVAGRDAASVMYACMDSEDVLHRRVDA